jgi:hypothetical protein
MIYTSRTMRRPARFISIGFVATFTLLLAAGCVRRQMTIESDPPGALVYLNGQEAGRTPLERDFVLYGTYDVQVRREGYETLKTRQRVIAPWWQWPPFDLVAELFPLTDRRSYTYKLSPAADTAIDLDAILSRSEEMRGKLESTRVAGPPPPTTEPTD